MSQRERISSEQLARSAAEGNSEAFEALMIRHEKGIYNLAYTKTRNAEDSYDITQETFLRTYKALKTFRGDSSFSTWLYRICFNVIYDMQKKNAIRQHNEMPIEMTDNDGNESMLDLPDNSYNPEMLAIENERTKMVRAGINRLNEKYRVPLILRDINGLSYNKIAEILNLELGTVKSRIKRARESLKDILRNSNLL